MHLDLEAARSDDCDVAAVVVAGAPYQRTSDGDRIALRILRPAWR